MEGPILNLSNRDFDRADELSEAERSAGVARIAAALDEEGHDSCVACGDPIALDRRLALPSAKRCAVCQSQHEHRRL